jgi:ADP-heptose:LPS heptosyltransferase
MDLIVSVDTSVVHLAGALGRPTLLMVPFWPDWRWGLDKKSNAWYPSIKLVRQQEIGSWRSVLNYVGDQIERAIKIKAK